MGRRAASVVDLDTAVYYTVRPMGNNSEYVVALDILGPSANCVKIFDGAASRLLWLIGEASDRMLIFVLKMKKTANTL